MRITITAILAAVVLTAPVAAQPRDPAGDGLRATAAQTTQEREQRQLPREGMRQAFGGQGRREDRRQYRQERREDFRDFRQERRDDRQEFRRERRDDRQDFREGELTRREFRRDRAEDVRDFRRDRAGDVRDFRRDRAQDDRRFYRDLNRDGRWGFDGRRWGFDDRGWDHDRGGWNRDWRRDPRYNWQDWRQRNRGSWRGRPYFAPRGLGFGYRRFALGGVLSAPLFAQNYWINDPWGYRLPPANGPYRWVRYYDDVLLVDIRDGRVVDAIHGFFW